MTQTVVLEHIYFDQRCTQGPGGKGEGKYRTPHANFKTLNLKNAIKPKTGGPPWQFFLKALTPLGICAKTLGTPLPWIFNT